MTTTPRRRQGIGASAMNAVKELDTQKVAQATSTSLKKLDRKAFDAAVQLAYEANLAANAQKNIADKARAQVLKMMQDAGLTLEKINFKRDDTTINLVAEIKTPETDTIDVTKLRKLVPDEKVFLQMVSASIKSVTDFAGSNVANQCKVSKLGNTNVTIGVAK